MEQKDSFPTINKKEKEQGPSFWYRVRFGNPFNPEEPMEREVVIHGQDDLKAAEVKARRDGNFEEGHFEVEAIEKFDPFSGEEHRRRLAQALPHIFKNKKK